MKADDSVDELAWLADEIASVRTKKYFVVDGSIGATVRGEGGSSFALPGSYLRFVERFGRAMLYRQHAGYGLGVIVPPREAESKGAERLLEFGHYLDRRAYFRAADLMHARECPVYESQAGGLVRVSDSFGEWLHQRATALRTGLGKRKWAEILAGPAPFSATENRIVEARKLFSWTCVGVHPSGDVAFEVLNGSAMTLPFLTVGVRAAGGGFTGRVFLPVSNIDPGEKKFVVHECYKKQLPRETMEAFELGDPIPEDRAQYWEFRGALP